MFQKNTWFHYRDWTPTSTVVRRLHDSALNHWVNKEENRRANWVDWIDAISYLVAELEKSDNSVINPTNVNPAKNRHCWGRKKLMAEEIRLWETNTYNTNSYEGCTKNQDDVTLRRYHTWKQCVWDGLAFDISWMQVWMTKKMIGCERGTERDLRGGNVTGIVISFGAREASNSIKMARPTIRSVRIWRASSFITYLSYENLCHCGNCGMVYCTVHGMVLYCINTLEGSTHRLFLRLAPW